MLIREGHLKSGIRLIVAEMPYAVSVSAGVYVNVGTRHEKWPEEAGISHALEHMVFHGNNAFASSQELAASLEDVGGDVNAWTSGQYTFYFAQVPAQYMPKAARYLYHIVSSPKLRERNARTEMLNVIEEIKRAEDNPAGYVQRIARDLVYGEHPLGREVLGIRERVASFDAQDFRAYHEKHYHAENYTILVAGNTTFDACVKLFNRYFRKNERREGNVRQHTLETRGIGKNEVRRDIQQAHAAFNALIGSGASPSTTALQIFTYMVDGGMSFPLFQEMREKRGLCYAVSASVRTAYDVGCFNMTVGTSPERLDEARDAMFDVLYSCVGNEELFERAQQLLRAKVQLAYEAPSNVVFQLMTDLANKGRVQSPDAVLAMLAEQTLDDIRDAVSAYLDRDRFVEAYILPENG